LVKFISMKIHVSSMVEFLIETTIDKFISLVRKRKRIRISEAAKILDVTQKQVDEWVFTLEDRGIVELKYPVLGEPEVAIIEETPEQIAAATRKEIEVDTRIIPGIPIKKKNLPKLKLRKIPEEIAECEGKEKQEDSSEYESILNEMKSLENRISEMASKRAENVNPSNLYITEKLKFLENKLHDLSKKTEEEKKTYETERLILKKIETIEDRLNKVSQKKEKKKLKISGTDDV
jgi:hypothetical protein